MASTFGQLIKEFRVNANLTLREFCKAIKYDAGNWSRIERDLAAPPKDNKFFARLQRILNLRDGDISTLKSIAESWRMIPKKFRDSDFLEHLPVMCRRANGEEPTDKEIEHLVDWLKRKVKEENS